MKLVVLDSVVFIYHPDKWDNHPYHFSGVEPYNTGVPVVIDTVFIDCIVLNYYHYFFTSTSWDVLNRK
jgi:hypothetical protein